MTLYRRHRGSLAASMETVIEIADIKHLARVIAVDLFGWPNAGITPAVVRVEPYGIDSRNGWNTYIVTVYGEAVGFTNGPLS